MRTRCSGLRRCFVGVCAAVTLASTSPARAEGPSAKPDVLRVGAGGELLFGGNGRANLAAWVSARAAEWLSLGVDAAWGWSGRNSVLVESSTGNLEKAIPWRVLATGRVLRRWGRVEPSMGVMLGVTAMHLAYDIRSETVVRPGGGMVAGLSVYPAELLSIDLELLLVVSPSYRPDRYEAHGGPRVGLSLHF